METEQEYFAEEKKSGKGKGGKYLEKEKEYHLRWRRKDAEGKGGKYLEKEFFKKKRRQISLRLSIGEGKIIVDGWRDGRVEGSRRNPRGSKKVTWKG